MILPAEKAKLYRSRIRESIQIVQSGCWIWKKAKARNGYGQFSLGGGKGARAHRISFLCFKGEIPKGMNVLHQCDIRDCVNPAHLFLGTQSQNIQDAYDKGRGSRTHQRKGATHPSAKLNDAKVIQILGLLRQGRLKNHIAKDFGVSFTLIALIQKNKAWRHIQRNPPPTCTTE